MLKKKFKVFLILIFLISTNSYAERIEGKALVIDGDTIKIGREKIRLFGIDAPEIKQVCKNENNDSYPCGITAKNYLSWLIKVDNENDEKIYCYYSERDKYKRIIGDCYIGADNEIGINYSMVFYGQAVAYTRYSEKYLGAQDDAKSYKFGLWSGTFVLPEEWRKNN